MKRPALGKHYYTGNCYAELEFAITVARQSLFIITPTDGQA